MNKAQLIEQVAARAELSQAMAKKAVDAFIDGIKASLSTHTPVALVGFGRFETARSQRGSAGTRGLANR